MQKSISIKIFLSLFSVIIISLAIFFIGNDIDARAANIENMKNTLHNSSELVKNLSIMQSDLNQVQPYEGAVNDLIINQDKLLDVLNNINGLAGQLKISVSPSFVGEESKTAGLGSIGLSINGNAGSQFDSLIQFFQYLEKGKYFFQFDNLDLSGSGNYNFSTNGRVFFIHE